MFKNFKWLSKTNFGALAVGLATILQGAGQNEAAEAVTTAANTVADAAPHLQVGMTSLIQGLGVALSIIGVGHKVDKGSNN